MTKSFFTFIFSFLLLIQTAIYAEETTKVAEESTIEDVLPTEKVSTEAEEPQEVQETENTPGAEETQEEISEAQKEADEAEAAELQEVDTGEEPEAE